jgi:hypothetical protein
MLTVRSKDCSVAGLQCADSEQSQHRTRAFLAGYCGVEAGGASRDRTGDLVLAKHALSQLSYGPSLRYGWWVWEELHLRPHPYQGCALTN